jgi:hypothetical protein
VARSRCSRNSAPVSARGTDAPAAREHPRGRRWLAPGTVGLAALVLGAACAAPPQPKVPGPPIVAGGAPAAVAQRPARPTPAPDRAIMLAEGDVVEAAQVFVQALYDADDATAIAYQPGFGPKLRENEDSYALVSMSGRPITWTEFGYPDADPDLEFAEVVARVQGRRNTEAGSFYYKIAFRRAGERLAIDQWSKRIDVR